MHTIIRNKETVFVTKFLHSIPVRLDAVWCPFLAGRRKLSGVPAKPLPLHYLRLPKDISEDHVILMDCTVSTGAAAMMAVRVLLDHDVPEDKIFLLSLLMAEMGVHSVAYAFPQVKIITTAVDKKVNDLFRIIPGIGNFGDRYFGTDAPPDWSDEEDILDA
uniref:Uridine-cytidine kinase-like 1 n=1 Tax=Sphaerodactylus townsendi TaxID=933632 RepID=A0ACB8F6N5_9SAUR